MMNTYQDCVEYLYSLISYETKPNWSYDNKSMNLYRFKEFLSRFGNPQKKLKIIHVAGSDGKGSTCAVISAVLQHMGYRVGLYTSPHLHSVRERIQINREWITKDAFVQWTNHLRSVLDTHAPGQSGFTTFFELITAMGFLYFQDEEVDFAVIETGLGGRLDATNVADPTLCIITHISMEHADKLGDTIEKIADEKLGIIRIDSPVVIGHQDKELLSHFYLRLEDHSASTVLVDEHYELISSSIVDNQRQIYCTYDDSSIQLTSPLLGSYQIQNVMTAHAALNMLSAKGLIQKFNHVVFNNGLQQTIWDGRFEVIHQGKVNIILDIAHTVKGAASLKSSLEGVFPGSKRIYVLGFLHDKNVQGIVETLYNENDHIIFTEPPTPRALPIDEVKKEIQSFQHSPSIQIEKDALKAFELAMQTADVGDVVVVAGSLYLVSAVRDKLVPQPED